MPTPKRPEAATEVMLPEYDFASMGKPVRGKYYERMKSGSNLVLLEPDLSEAFPTSDSVNAALRSLLELARSVDPKTSKARRKATRSAR